MIISRPRLQEALRAALEHLPVVVLTGPRQCGKTTLARQLLEPTAPPTSIWKIHAPARFWRNR